MSNDRKAVILGRLQRFTTVTPSPQASGPFHLLRWGRCPRSLDACTASRPPAGTGSRTKARVSLSPVCGPYYTRDARPPAGHQQMLHTCSPSERAPFPGRDRAPSRVLRVRVGPHLPGAALGLPAALSPSVQSPSQIQPVPTLARRSPLVHPSGHGTGTRQRRTRVGGGALAGSCGGECHGTQSGGGSAMSVPGTSRTAGGGATRTLPGEGQRGW